jgi:transcriptional regulator with XRE-family HTH domain
MSDWSDIGAQLRATRERMGVSLPDISHRTRIPVHTLHELEENNYSSFPSPAYAKSFLAQYSEHLGVDANEWLDVFDTGNVLADLDSYDYLKHHEEVIGKERGAHREAEAPAPAALSVANSIQPLVVFLVTASVVTGTVFGVLYLNSTLAERGEGPAAESVEPDDGLRPISSFPDSRPARPKREPLPAGFENSLVMASEQPGQIGGDGSDQSAGDGTGSAAEVIGAAPPRAIIIEE